MPDETPDNPADLLDRVAEHTPGTAGRILDGEAVVVTPVDGQMHTLNRVGTFIWQQIDGVRTLQTVALDLAEAFDVDLATARTDTLGFVEDLCQRGVLRITT